MDMILLIFGIVFFVVITVALLGPKDKGKDGEAKVSRALSKSFGKNLDYVILNDVLLKEGNDSTQIDHIVFSVYGIFVVETKNYSGYIYGDENKKTWTQHFKKKKFPFQNPHRQNYKHLKFLSEILNIEMNKMLSLVVFIGDAKFKNNGKKRTFKSTRNLNNFIKKQKLKKFTRQHIFSMRDQVKARNLNKIKKEEKAHIKRVQKRVRK
jgi:hypothetical protein